MIVRLSGDWTIERAAELKGLLLDALSKDDRVAVNLEEVTAVDLSFLQLLCSSHRASLNKGKHLELEGELPGPVRRLVVGAGLVRTVGCRRDPLESCLWGGGFDRWERP